MNQTPHDRTQFIIGIVGLVLVVGAIVWFRPDPQAPVQPVPGEDTTPITLSWPSTYVRDARVDDTTDVYSITGKYPVTESDAINSTFSSMINKQIASFKEDISWATDSTDPSASYGELSLMFDYTNTKATRADNYVFTTGQYTGGAHGLQVSTTFTYDAMGTSITLQNLFTNGEKGLATVMPYVRAELAKGQYSSKDWYEEGTEPVAQNYRNFIVTDGGVTFIFDPYQVAPYAAGKVQVTVPVSEFRAIANKTLFPSN